MTAGETTEARTPKGVEETASGRASDDADLPEVLAELSEDVTPESPEEQISAALESMVLHPDYPCLGARSVFNRERARVLVLDELGSAESGRLLLHSLREFARDTDTAEGFASFVAVFREPAELSEPDFERLLWTQLAHVHAADHASWNGQVSEDPDDPHFAFSVAGTAYFVVGMHPGSSRLARRTPLPTLVFNLHEQFEELRREDRFTRMRDTIRRRDTALQGSTNPMVDDHGTRSEARQYAGRAVPDDWHPPVPLEEGGDR